MNFISSKSLTVPKNSPFKFWNYLEDYSSSDINYLNSFTFKNELLDSNFLFIN